MEAIKLNTKQLLAIESIKEGKSVFLTGSAGTGKSFTVDKIMSEVLDEGRSVEVTGMTGAASALVNGRTIHSFMALGMDDLPLKTTIERTFTYNSDLFDRWINMGLLVIDEISMADPKFMNKLNEFCTTLMQIRKGEIELRLEYNGHRQFVKWINREEERLSSSIVTSPYFPPKNNEDDEVVVSTAPSKKRKRPEETSTSEIPFGGMRMLFVGDFYQLPPVNKTKSPTEYAFEASCWRDLFDPANNLGVVIELDEVFRQGDEVFLKNLRKLRNGSVDSECERFFRSLDRPPKCAPGVRPMRLYCKNVDVDKENEMELSRVAGEEKIYRTKDTFTIYENSTKTPKPKTQKDYDKMFSHIPTSVKLKVGAQVMMTSNFMFDKGLYNGAIGVVTDFHSDDRVEVEFASGTHIIEFNRDSKEENKVWYIRFYLPLRLAYATTIHKSQGMSLDPLFVDLNGAFTPGQVYVACSRARTVEGLQVANFKRNAVMTDSKVIEYYKSTN